MNSPSAYGINRQGIDHAALPTRLRHRIETYAKILCVRRA